MASRVAARWATRSRRARIVPERERCRCRTTSLESLSCQVESVNLGNGECRRRRQRQKRTRRRCRVFPGRKSAMGTRSTSADGGRLARAARSSESRRRRTPGPAPALSPRWTPRFPDRDRPTLAQGQGICRVRPSDDRKSGGSVRSSEGFCRLGGSVRIPALSSRPLVEPSPAPSRNPRRVPAP